MKIEVNAKELLTPEIAKLTEQAARQAGLPLEIYVFKTYNKFVENGNPNVSLTDTLVQEKAEVKVAEPLSGVRKPLVKAYGPFDHLKLKEGKAEVRAHNLLVNNFKDVDDLLSKTKEEILEIKGFGKGSLDLIVERLIKEGHITSEDDFGSVEATSNNNTLKADDDDEEYEEDDDEEYEDEDEYDDEDWHLQVSEIDPSLEDSVAQAARIYQEAWHLDKEEASSQIREFLQEIGYKKSDPDTWRFAILAIKDRLPMTDNQSEQIWKIGSSIGENKTETEERAIAMCGKDFKDLNYLEAKTLLDEMREDYSKNNVNFDDDLSF